MTALTLQKYKLLLGYAGFVLLLFLVMVPMAGGEEDVNQLIASSSKTGTFQPEASGPQKNLVEPLLYITDLSKRFVELESQMDESIMLSGVQSDISDISGQIQLLSQQVSETAFDVVINYDQLEMIKTKAYKLENRVKKTVSNPIFKIIENLSELNTEWAQKKEVLDNWGKIAKQDISFKLVEAEITAITAKIPVSGNFSGRARVQGTVDRLAMEDLSAAWKMPQQTDVQLKGRIENLFALTGFDLRLNGELENPGFLTTELPESLGPLDRIAFSTKISGDYPHLGIRECTLDVKTVNALALNLAGQLDLTGDHTGLQAENMDVTLNFTAPDTHSARAIFFEAVPEFGAVQGKAQIHSNKGAPSLEKIVVQTRDAKGIQVDLKGRIDRFPFDPDIPNTGYDLDVKMTSVKTAVMGERLGMELPLSGPLDITYRIEGDTQALHLERIDLSAGEKNGIQINIDGRVVFGKWDQADPIEHIDLAVRMKSQNTNALGEATGKQVPEMGRAKARLHTVSGNHRLVVIAQDLQKIGSLLGQEWPKIGPVELDSSIVKKEEGFELDTRMTVGAARIDGITHIISRRGTPFISGKITAQNLFLPSMVEKKNKPAKDKKTAALFFFSREPLPVDRLKKIDMDLSVDIASFDKESINLESAQFRIDLESGSLKIKSARLVCPKGEITLDVLLELEKDLKIIVNASGKGINPWQTLAMRQTDMRNDFNAELDIDIDITSSGGSEHELAANLDGDIYLIIKNGKMRKEPFDMLFTDFIGWTIGKATGEKYVGINCGVADYRITKGVITTKAFIIDGKNITIAGEGSIDLAQEQIDYVFLPKKKSKLIQRADPVKVSGPLNNPSVKVLPCKSAAATYGSLFFGPYVFAGVMTVDFLKDTVRNNGTTSPCSEYEKKHDQDPEPGSSDSKE